MIGPKHAVRMKAGGKRKRKARGRDHRVWARLGAAEWRDLSGSSLACGAGTHRPGPE